MFIFTLLDVNFRPQRVFLQELEKPLLVNLLLLPLLLMSPLPGDPGLERVDKGLVLLVVALPLLARGLPRLVGGPHEVLRLGGLEFRLPEGGFSVARE